MSQFRWVLLTGEYPPQSGGVSDYSRLVALGLAEAGDEVHVWAPAGSDANPASLVTSSDLAPATNYPAVHRLAGKFRPRDLDSLDRSLNRLAKPYRLLVQYVPHAFGCKGMNVPFCWWLSRRREPVWIMFHEVAFPFACNQPLGHNMLSMVTRLMVNLVAREAERIFVSIPAWEALLPNSPNVRRRVTWLPVPSNISTVVSLQAVWEVRQHVAPDNEIIIGHFGTYGPAVTGLLAEILPPLLRKDSKRRALLIGKDSDGFAVALRRANPRLQGRIDATGCMETGKIAAHLAACDCLVQPFIDGVSSRRTSIMAGLALGLPIVTNAGPLTDSVWKETEGLVVMPSTSITAIRDAVDNVLAQPNRLIELRRNAPRFYHRNFALSRTIQILRTETTGWRLTP